jgi:uncharacterized protein YukJ
MQKEFKLSPLDNQVKTYKWENGAWPDAKYAVLYQDKIIAIFDTLYWAKEFCNKINLTMYIMKVDE